MTAAVPTLRRPTDWHRYAACTSYDPDWWYSDHSAEQQQAKAICAGCPVAALCLAAAIERGEAHGIHGGLDTPERAALAVATGQPKPTDRGRWQHGTDAGYKAHGCKCTPCREAHRIGNQQWRQRATPATTRATIDLDELTTPAGHGHHTAWPGQLYWSVA